MKYGPSFLFEPKYIVNWHNFDFLPYISPKNKTHVFTVINFFIDANMICSKINSIQVILIEL